MAWNSSTKILTKPFTKIGVSQGDLEKALGVSTKKTQIQLFTETDIKIAAKYKPFRHTTAVFSTSGATTGDRQTARESANYGITIPECTTAQLLTANWSYDKPDGTTYPFRALDFDGYYADPPIAPVCCITQGIISADTINLNATSPAKFYIYQKNGALKDMPIDPDRAIGTVAVGRSTTQIDAICSLDDLKVNGGTIYSKTNPYLGLALYQGTTFKKFVPCTSQLIASQSPRVNDMFIMSLTDFTNAGVANGTYTGIACVRYGSSSSYKYAPLPKIPLASGATYQNSFEVRVGGADLYTYFQRGLAKTNTTSSSGTLTMTSSSRFSDVWVTIRVRNDSGIEHQSGLDNSNWILISTVKGTVNGSAFPTAGRVVRSTMANYYPGTSGQFVTINKDGTVDITFRIQNVWSPTGASGVVVSSGSLTITCQLVYNAGGADDPFTRGSEIQQTALSLSYSA